MFQARFAMNGRKLSYAGVRARTCRMYTARARGGKGTQLSRGSLRAFKALRSASALCRIALRVFAAL